MSCELPDCFRKVTRTARKKHKCIECRGWINPGERYVYASGIWSGDAQSYKFCPVCDSLWSEVMDERNDPEDGEGYGGLYLEIFDGSNIDWMERYVGNAQARGGALGTDNWMAKRLSIHTQLNDHH